MLFLCGIAPSSETTGVMVERFVTVVTSLSPLCTVASSSIVFSSRMSPALTILLSSTSK